MELELLSNGIDLSSLLNHHPFSVKKKTLIDVLAKKDDQTVAIGQILPMIELLLMEDLDKSKKLRVEALKLLMTEAIFQAGKLNIQQLHAFCRDEKFAAILKKHWGFTPCSGEALVLNL